MTVDLMPFRVVDLETTDFQPHGVPIELGFCDVKQCGPIASPILPPGAFGSVLINPGVPIPPQSSAIHHIIDVDVADAEPFATAVRYLAPPEFAAAYVAHNIAMERHYLGHLTGDRPWICTWKCALHLWPEAPSHSNQALRYWLNPDGLDRSRAHPAHRAGPDAYVTAWLLYEMLKIATVEQLVEWTSQPALLVRIPFGNLKGRPWSEADDGFLDWVLERDFDEDVMFTAAHHQALRRTQRAAATAFCAEAPA